MSDVDLTPDEVRVLKKFAAFLLTGGRPAGAQPGVQPAAAPGGGSGVGGRVASSFDLQGKYGDAFVKKDPKFWVGPSYAGAQMSRCPSDYLLVLADFLDWQGVMDTKKPDPPKHTNGTPYYEYKFKDAGLARGWAKKNEGKEMPPPALSSSPGGGHDPEDAPYHPASSDDDLPF